MNVDIIQATHYVLDLSEYRSLNDDRSRVLFAIAFVTCHQQYAIDSGVPHP